MLYELDDIVIIPEAFNAIEDREECNPYDKDGLLPVFLSPDCCTRMESLSAAGCKEHRIASWLISLGERKGLRDVFVEMGVPEVSELMEQEEPGNGHRKIMLSGTSGHNLAVYDLVCEIKEKYGDSWEVMVTGVENPDTFAKYVEAEADYVCIGGGGRPGWEVSEYTGTCFPLASLITECREAVDGYGSEWSEKSCTKIVACGDFKNFGQMNKALALGADYIMVGDREMLSESHFGRDGGITFKDALTDMMYKTGSRTLEWLKSCQWDVKFKQL